jgi:hypothetical protein
MGFFEPPPPPPEPEPEEHDWEAPEWIGPPSNVLGAPVALQVMLHRSDQLAIAVTGIVVFRTGFKFSVLTKATRDAELEEMGPPHWMWRHRRLAEGLPDDLFRFGVQFADGRKATNLISGLHGLDPDQVPGDGPVLSQRGGGGGGGDWKQGYWLWPLPPPGELGFVCEWPAHGITETRVAIDATPIIAAAEQAVVLWDAPQRRGRGSHAYRLLRSHQQEQPPDTTEAEAERKD